MTTASSSNCFTWLLKIRDDLTPSKLFSLLLATSPLQVVSCTYGTSLSSPAARPCLASESFALPGTSLLSVKTLT